MIIPGKNDLQKLNPELASEWHPTKNGGILSNQVALNSNKKYWWCCSSCGYEWEATPNARNRGRGCPKCARIRAGKSRHKYCVAIQGSLAERYPELAEEWCQEKNGDFYPEDCAPGSHKKVWWKCPQCSNEWEAVVFSRTKDNGHGNGCPVCGRRKTKNAITQ